MEIHRNEFFRISEHIFTGWVYLTRKGDIAELLLGRVLPIEMRKRREYGERSSLEREGDMRDVINSEEMSISNSHMKEYVQSRGAEWKPSFSWTLNAFVFLYGGWGGL